MKKYIWILTAIVLFIAATAGKTGETPSPTAPSDALMAVTSIPTVGSTPETQGTSTPVTSVPETQPTAPAATTEATYPEDVNLPPVVAAIRKMARESWTSPLKAEFGEITGSRRFASSRSSGARAHAGVDFVAPHGTSVYAITDGTVQRVAGFYLNTMAVEIVNDDGSILRYCEIDPIVEVGDNVTQGQKIGTILRADSGTEMLHMEVYTGEATGKLTQSDNRNYPYVEDELVYMRRWDLLDPTFLTELPCFTGESADNS